MSVESGTASKVTAAHRAKLAYVYIRQSSPLQVIRHAESTDLQYQLVERAVSLGWPRDRIQIIDDDLGKSGASAEQRAGFQLLMSEVGLGRAGLVMSLDASRLARNNGDWYRLLDLCSLFGTLIADGERLYEPRAYHDRLVLGLSGMMSEAELHHLKMRLQAGARHKAERGQLQLPLPVGLTRQRDGSVILNPDQEVQERLRLIFAKFTELGSAHAVREYLRRERLLVPSRPPHGPAPQDTVWEPPRQAAILRILHNPAYAGAYVYGRRVADPVRRQPGRRSGVVQLPREQWAVCLPDAHPGYISWDAYLANQAQLQANRNDYGQDRPGVVRQGQALLQGIALCSRCGRHMPLRYSGQQGTFPVYYCKATAQEFGGPLCQEVRALGVDAEVERQLLAALQPDQLALAVEALDQLALERTTRERQWHLRLERVRYEAQRVRRQYDEVEPENRLVARSLERAWEEKLRAVEQVEREYQEWKQEHRTEISAQERQEILALGEDLPQLWRACTTTAADRKYLLRLVIKEVLLDQKRERGKVWLQINWQTGASTQHVITRTCISYREHGEGEGILQRIRTWNAQGATDQKVAQALNAEGFRTTYGQPFRYQNIYDLRKQQGIANAKEAGLTPDRLRWSDGRYTVQGVAKATGVTKGTVHAWLERGLIAGEHAGRSMLWQIALNEDQIRSLQERARPRRTLPSSITCDTSSNREA
jgi:DNA invertase Pin-like site-specific DNA recombinase